MLQVSQIKKAYKDLQVLKGIDLEIENGEIVSIVGASGAGKSTLLQIMGTLDRPDSGEVRFNGTLISALPDKALAAFRNTSIGFIFQFHNLLPEFTALENICLPGYIAKRKTAEVQDKAMKLMEMLGIASRFGHKPSQLSGGEQQRAAVARALINSPEIIFADEPSGNLDSANAEELHHLFLNLRKQFRQTFVIVTHNPHLADLADRKLVMKDGLLLSN